MPSKMKAVVMDGFGSADVLHMGTVERPVPDDTQVLVQVAATSVNRPDIVQREGNYPPPLENRTFWASKLRVRLSS